MSPSYQQDSKCTHHFELQLRNAYKNPIKDYSHAGLVGEHWQIEEKITLIKIGWIYIAGCMNFVCNVYHTIKGEIQACALRNVALNQNWSTGSAGNFCLSLNSVTELSKTELHFDWLWNEWAKTRFLSWKCRKKLRLSQAEQSWKRKIVETLETSQFRDETELSYN